MKNYCLYTTHVVLMLLLSRFSESVADDVTRQPPDDTTNNHNSQSDTPRVSECFSLTEGIPGPAGPPGDFGEPGEPGAKGQDGLQGRDGIPGENFTVSGLNGDRGERGQPGPCGQPGPAGTIGLEGPVGNRGPEGPVGPPGENVSRSSDGYKGGESGLPGAQGLPGIKGEKGVNGKDGECKCSPEEGDIENLIRFSAFSVSRHSSLLSTNGDQIIWWDHVFTNAGNHFAPELGIFTCEIPGHYYFAFHIHKTSDSPNPLVQLMHNGVHVGSALEYGDVDDEDSTTNSVVIHLELYDQVWLQLYDATGFHGSHNGFTTFHGYLAAAD